MKILVLLVFTSALAEDPSKLLKDFSAGHIQFTADVYKKLKASSDNFIVYPLALEIILAVTQAGARGQTAQQLSSGLHLPENPETIHKMFSQLTSTLKSNDREYQLSSANKIYVKDGLAINTTYERTAADVFAGEVENINFTDKVGSAKKINEWVEVKTLGKIINLVAPELLDKSNLALINVMYLHGTWEKQFDRNETASDIFRLNFEKQVETDTLTQMNYFNYYESTDFDAKFLELPFRGGVGSMTVVLPNNVDGLEVLETRIPEVLAVPAYKEEHVFVEIPKFKTESTVNFISILEDLGIQDAFSGNANFSGMIADKSQLQITSVLQKSSIEVNEIGTTGAAASADAGRPSRMNSLASVKYFRATQPFLYYLKHGSTIVSVGRYVSP